jgi:hypothetical protein
MAQPKNVIFWGAGATADLGIRTTKEQTKLIQLLTGTREGGKPLEERIALAFGRNGKESGLCALKDLITILGDSDDAYDSIHHINAEQMSIMQRNCEVGTGVEDLQKRIVHLRLIYDWPALKSVVRICPASATAEFRINDLFNLLDMHIPIGFGFPAPAGNEKDGSGKGLQQQFFDARRLIGAKNALYMILTTMFYIDYQECLRSKRDRLDKYFDVADQIGRRMQRQGVKLAGENQPFDEPEFYQGDIGFVSLNYDPISLWMQFIAYRELNNSGAVPHIGSPAVPLHLYHDFGHMIPARGISRPDPKRPWYPLNVAAAQRLNEVKYPSGYRVRLTKLLFPHGCLCWRGCPNCGKLSAYHPTQWDRYAADLFPPPPFRAFDPTPCPGWVGDSEKKERGKGSVDARACLHCGTLTYAHHTQTVMQSSFKSLPPSFIEEIQRDLRATAMQADHFIFMGYSLPQDDVTYRAFFSASRQRGRTSSDPPVRCTIVGKDPSNPGWYGPTALEARKSEFEKDSVVRAAQDIFGIENVRFFGGGIPDVFLDGGGKVTADKLEYLLNSAWT